jgi:hypothetical protein
MPGRRTQGASFERSEEDMWGRWTMSVFAQRAEDSCREVHAVIAGFFVRARPRCGAAPLPRETTNIWQDSRRKTAPGDMNSV